MLCGRGGSRRRSRFSSKVLLIGAEPRRQFALADGGIRLTPIHPLHTDALFLSKPLQVPRKMGHHASKHHLTIDEYLSFERSGSIKHEYAAGHVFAMAGASERHNRIALNLGAHLHRATRGSDCVAFISDMRVCIDQVIYYPDLMVCGDPADNDPYLKRAPCLVIEVLSDSTERIDRGEKLHNYRQVASLQAYVLVAQDKRQVEIYRRTDGPHWQFESYEGDEDVIELPCAAGQMTLAEIYERIEFPPGP